MVQALRSILCGKLGKKLKAGGRRSKFLMWQNKMKIQVISVQRKDGFTLENVSVLMGVS